MFLANGSDTALSKIVTLFQVMAHNHMDILLGISVKNKEGRTSTTLAASNSTSR